MRLTTEMMDTIVKYAFGPRKMKLTEVAKTVGTSEPTVGRILGTYRMVSNGQIDELITFAVKNSVSKDTLAWAFDYHGVEPPADLDERIKAQARSQMFTEEEKKEPKKAEKADEDNVAVLCGRLNALGQALSDCLTEETASKLTDKIVSALAQLRDSVNANADNCLAELKKHTEILHRIEFNTKKRNQNQK